MYRPVQDDLRHQPLRYGIAESFQHQATGAGCWNVDVRLGTRAEAIHGYTYDKPEVS